MPRTRLLNWVSQPSFTRACTSQSLRTRCRNSSDCVLFIWGTSDRRLSRWMSHGRLCDISWEGRIACRLLDSNVRCRCSTIRGLFSEWDSWWANNDGYPTNDVCWKHKHYAHLLLLCGQVASEFNGLGVRL